MTGDAGARFLSVFKDLNVFGIFRLRRSCGSWGQMMISGRVHKWLFCAQRVDWLGLENYYPGAVLSYYLPLTGIGGAL